MTLPLRRPTPPPLPPFPLPCQDPARVARERMQAGWTTAREAAVERMLADWVD